jgi:hypothetical protein
MSLIQSIKSRLFDWTSDENWAKVDTNIVHEVVEEHEESWDLEVWWAYKYRHKQTGDVRWKLAYHRGLGETHTTFSDPTNSTIEWNSFGGSFTSEPANWYDIYKE